MNRKNAARILKTQIEKIDNIHHSEHRLFLDQTKTYIVSFFSKDSHEYDYIKHFYFSDFSVITKGSTRKSNTIDDLKNELKKFLTNCIETINNIDLYKPPIDNWFSKLPDWLMSLILTTLFGLGIVIGNVTSDKQNFKLRQDNKELRSLLKSSDSISNHYKKLSGNPK